MGADRLRDGFDVVVIGSGMGGMTTAAALARFKHKVLLLEQAAGIGGLTRAFSRDDFRWDVGLHYCGMFGPEQQAGRILDWLSDGTIEFRSLGTVYDTLHFPDGFDIAVECPAAAYRSELKERFPAKAHEIDAYFKALMSAQDAARLIFAERSMPKPLRTAHRWWKHKEIARWCNRTTGDVIGEFITDPKLAAILQARWGTFGGNPREASFCLHATIMAHYLEGAAYPVGGAATIADGLVPIIESAGGSVRADAAVCEIVVENRKAVAVRTSAGEEFRAPVVVSSIGARETVKRLLPPEIRAQQWAREIAGFGPSVAHFEVYLGFEGEIERFGATRANHWFYESWDTSDGIWSSFDQPIPMMFASFPSLKDPAHDPGLSKRHTGQFMTLANWSSVAEFADGGASKRPDEWAAFKADIETKMLAFYAARFPGLAPLIVYHELGTPLATADFTAHENGGFYGVEATPRRMSSDALNASTPVHGLYLTGQDVVSPGIAGAFMGGLLCAAAIDPRVFQRLKQ